MVLTVCSAVPVYLWFILCFSGYLRLHFVGIVTLPLAVETAVHSILSGAVVDRLLLVVHDDRLLQILLLIVAYSTGGHVCFCFQCVRLFLAANEVRKVLWDQVTRVVWVLVEYVVHVTFSSIVLSSIRNLMSLWQIS